MLMLNNLILPSLLTQLEMLRHTRRVDWPGVPPGNQTLTPTHIWSSALYGSTIVKIQIQIRSDPHTHSHVIFFPLSIKFTYNAITCLVPGGCYFSNSWCVFLLQKSSDDFFFSSKIAPMRFFSSKMLRCVFSSPKELRCDARASGCSHLKPSYPTFPWAMASSK